MVLGHCFFARYVPVSQEIIGILSQLQEDMEGELKSITDVRLSSPYRDFDALSLSCSALQEIEKREVEGGHIFSVAQMRIC